jgi:hypothetical protein
MGSELSSAETTKVVATLNRILELELAGLVRYLHYSFMIFGHNRIPIVSWLRGQADEAQAHSVQAGEHTTSTMSTRSCAKRWRTSRRGWASTANYW